MRGLAGPQRGVLRPVNDRRWRTGYTGAMMTIRFRAAARIAAALAASLAASAAGAQDSTPSPPDDDREIVVEAPRTVPAPPPPPGERSSTTGAPIMVLKVQIPVLFGDLDLGDPADRARLDARIQNVARTACATLDRAYPLTSDPDCVRVATANAERSLEARLNAISK